MQIIYDNLEYEYHYTNSIMCSSNCIICVLSTRMISKCVCVCVEVHSSDGQNARVGETRPCCIFWRLASKYYHSHVWLIVFQVWIVVTALYMALDISTILIILWLCYGTSIYYILVWPLTLVDQITGENIQSNSTSYWSKLVDPCVRTSTKWAVVFGNHGN